jgi:HEAT repeat protein
VTAQTSSAPPSRPSGLQHATELAKGWTALAAGRAAEAEAASDAILKASPRSVDALSLKIRACLALNRPGSALDAYDSRLPHVQQREDASLLEVLVIGILESHARSKAPDVRARALETLAQAGDREAHAQLTTLMTASGAGDVRSLTALARLGDANAVKRLAARITSGGSRDVTNEIDALREGGVKSAATVIASALDATRPMPTKMAAARALGELGDVSVVPRLLEALKDPDPPVRVIAATALARLGDPSGATLVQSFINSPVGDIRLLAIEGEAPTNPNGAWTTVANETLKDPDPLVRLQAAELLLRYAADSRAARDVLQRALNDPNPAMQDAAAQRLDRLPSTVLAQDLPSLRRLLRAPSALTQIDAAAGILKMAGALP